VHQNVRRDEIYHFTHILYSKEKSRRAGFQFYALQALDGMSYNSGIVIFSFFSDFSSIE
jgi:hypothetical protein